MIGESNMTTRRIVTALDQHGKSYIKHDGETPGYLDLDRAINEEIWIDDPNQSGPIDQHDPAAAAQFNLSPPLGGSCVRVFTFIPNALQTHDPAVIASAASKFNTGDSMDPDNPGMHTTASIDYGIVLSGQITLELDQGTIDLNVGDIVVQRATPHAWRNLSDEPCTMLFVLISSPNYSGI